MKKMRFGFFARLAVIDDWPDAVCAAPNAASEDEAAAPVRAAAPEAPIKSLRLTLFPIKIVLLGIVPV